MSVRVQLLSQLARFDDDSFVALANRGLLRRAQKDLELQSDVRTVDAHDALTVHISQQQVRFDARGPAHAQCSCPSTGVCQHILAASLWLQRQGAAAPQESIPPTEVPVPATGSSELMQSLLSIDEVQLRKHAGKAGYRWAWQFVQDLDIESDLRVGGDRNLVVSFARPRLTFRFMGGGLEQLIGDTQLSQIEKYRVAAVLALRRVQGIDLPPPETAKPRTAALDLGKDHALPEQGEQARGDSRARLRRSARQLIEECIELGLSHLSQGTQERFSTLATWAQGCEYYRLALALRRLADHVEMLLERSGGADEHRLLDELALTYALIKALHSAEQKGLEPAHLVGRARHRYDESTTLELVGLGARPWRSASGYVGLTMLFWSPEDRSFLSCTDARPEFQGGFNPVHRYNAPGPWSGMGAPAQANGRLVVLGKPQISAVGRISGSERTQATILPIADIEALRTSLAPFNNWSTLGKTRAEAQRSLLAEHDPMKDWVALQPSRFGTPTFDAARQTLIAPLLDASDDVIRAEIPYSELSAHAIERLEQWATHPPPSGSILIARLRVSDGGIVVEPLSVLAPVASSPSTLVDSLYFDPAPTRGMVENIVGKLRKLGPRASPNREMVRDTVVPPALTELQEWIRRQAERGASKDMLAGWQSTWTNRANSLRALGFSAFPTEPLAEASLSAELLRAHYTTMQYQVLLGFSPEAD